MAYTDELLSTLQRRHLRQTQTPLDEDDENALQYLRGATRDTRRKIEDLEAELASRERAYEAEAARRRSLEQRLSSRLVDMYSGAPGVASELHLRLPRSRASLSPGDLLDGPAPALRPADLSLAPPERRAPAGGLLLTSPAVGAPLVLSPISLPLPATAAAPARPDGADSRQLAALLSELEAVKDENRRLQTRVAEVQKEVDGARSSATAAREEVEALVAAEVATLVKEVHAAQKSRDEAMMVRLRIANDERDAALSRLHASELGADVKPQNVATESAVNPTRVNQQFHENKDSSEVDLLREERDTAVMKFQQLQQDYNALRRRNLPEDAFVNNFDGNAALQMVKAERDEAVRKLQEMEDEMQTLRVYYSLHKSLSPEMMNNQLVAQDGDQLRAQAAALQDRVQSLTMELEQTRQELEESRQGHVKMEAETMKLNRLVAVLRRKLSSPDRLAEH